MAIRYEIVRILSDGRFHSGTEIGRSLGVSRAAVCKGVKTLREVGLDVHRVPGRGYRLVVPFQPLDEQQILNYLIDFIGDFQGDLTILQEVDSTNRYLVDQVNNNAPTGSVCLAEVQTRGRGRHGRQWIASPYSSLMLSMAWRFDTGPSMVSGLSLAAGVAVVRAMQDCGVAGLGLKWPNDVVWRERKLAGLLVDLHGEAGGPCLVILGLGVNVHIAACDGHRIDQPWTDLHTVCGSPVDRNRLAALVIGQLWGMFRTFERDGLAPFQDAWERLHVHAGQRVRVVTSTRAVWGKALGIDATGALSLLEDNGTTRRYACGEISLRPVS